MLEESKRIKNAITASGLSYMELEKITGISHSTIQRYAVGKTDRLPLSAIEKLAKALGVSAAWIVGWDNLPSALSPHENKVITAYRDKPLVQPHVDKLLDIQPEEEKAPSEKSEVWNGELREVLGGERPKNILKVADSTPPAFLNYDDNGDEKD